ncbi:MAG: cation diffusion facilitator CzcD-associated flavoprotein CzcO [Halioglobus sp.]|jgi:cation diffusion facilitator CzcD-associated flavoprotein CzcO
MGDIQHFDVVIVGAGISGIGSAVHLQKKCPQKSYVILEGRARLGGTWDLFRYPGIRSDSDMYTLGYVFKPWTHENAIADAPTILEYLKETTAENRINDKIRYGRQVKTASWSSDDCRWTVTTQLTDGASSSATEESFTCGFLHMCSGYYNYDEGYTPDFEGRDSFTGQVVHPQKWTSDINYDGKRVVVIGSGATAVTLIPELAKTAAHVTMLQRSPTYVVSRPAKDKIANWLRSVLPDKVAYFITRWKNVLMQQYVYKRCMQFPAAAKERIINMVRDEMGPEYDVDTHFTPSYNPWDQRLCLVPDSDLFESLKSGSASIVTDHIDRFTETGILLKSGETLEADLIVTATGLQLQFLSDVQFTVDGKSMKSSEALVYKGMMLSDVPNMALSMGYTNASWTLKCDLTCDYICRMLNYMDGNNYQKCTPRNANMNMEREPYLGLASGYVARAAGQLPGQGLHPPWRLHQNYLKDIFMLRHGKLKDEAMEFSP